MKALVLAAGCGRRLWPLTAQMPKCLLELCGRTLLEHLLQGIRDTRVREVVLVCGHAVQRVQRELCRTRTPLPVRVLYNPFYAMSDNLVSLWTARSELEGEIMLLNGDALFHPAIYQLLDAAPASIAVLVARKDRYSDDDMKVRLIDQRIVAIGKDLDAETADATAIGGLHISPAGVTSLRRALERTMGEPHALASHFPTLLQRLAQDGDPAASLDVGGLPWADLDTLEDLRLARERIDLFRDAAHGAPWGERA